MIKFREYLTECLAGPEVQNVHHCNSILGSPLWGGLIQVKQLCVGKTTILPW